MPGWTPFAGWMRFDRLDDGHGLTQAFTLAYKITDDSTDSWTSKFIRYKTKEKVALVGAITTFQVAVPALVRALGLDPGRTLFVPALSSGETVASDKSFHSILARYSAEACGSPHNLGVLSKNVHQPIHSAGGASGRSGELDKAAYKASRINGFRNIVIVDDLITRGGTMSRISQALQTENNGLNVYGIALGKTERRSWVPTLTNDHVSQQWDQLWQAGEQRYNARIAGG